MNQYKGIPIQTIVDDKEWQDLRKSFIGTWKMNEPGNLERLMEYLGDMSDEMRLVRVFNYLTGSGFRMGKIGGVLSVGLKNAVSNRLREFK